MTDTSGIAAELLAFKQAGKGEDVRDALISAITKCYEDVNNGSLREDAFAAALQEAIDNGGVPLAVDSVLSSSSENPVQNKVIKEAIDGISDTIGLTTEQKAALIALLD